MIADLTAEVITNYDELNQKNDNSTDIRENGDFHWFDTGRTVGKRWRLLVTQVRSHWKAITVSLLHISQRSMIEQNDRSLSGSLERRENLIFNPL